jgi:RNA polymerase sigma-70 factor (ECF subfamily)
MIATEQYTDSDIIGKVLTGDMGVFEILIRRNNSGLYKIGRSYGYNHEDTQDLMQDTFIDAYINLAGFKNQSSFKTWIFRIMLNHCYRKRQKASFKNERTGEIHEKSVPMFSDGQLSDANKTAIYKELGGIIESALQRIPNDYRMVFSLREINGLNVQETADILGITEVNVKVRLNRARALLKKEVEMSYSAEEMFEFNLVFCDAMVSRVMSKLRKQKHRVL